MNIVPMRLGGVFKPLALDQAAPPGFLFLAKLFCLRFGASEWALRLLPNLAVCLSLLLFYPVLKGLVAPAAEIVAVMLLALAQPIIDQGVAFKQYSFDALVTVLLLLAARFSLDRPDRAGRFPLIEVSGCLAAWFSFPSVFITGGIGLTGFFADLRAGRRRDASLWLATMFVCALNFGAAYMLMFRYYLGNHALTDRWAYAFAPMPPRSVRDLKWYWDHFRGLMYLLGVLEATLAGILFAYGIYHMSQDRDRTHRLTIPLILWPLGLTLFASALHKYPFSDRLLIFSVPILAIGVGSGLAAVAVRSQRSVLAAMLGGALMLYSSYLSVKYLVSPGDRVFQDVKPALADLKSHGKEGDCLFVNWDAETLYTWYADIINYQGMRRFPRIVGKAPAGVMISPNDVSVDVRRGVYEQQIKSLEDPHRLWLVFGIAGQSEANVFLELLDRRGQRLYEHHEPAAAVYLYDLKPGSREVDTSQFLTGGRS
jgi:hypothetical protein